MMLGTVLLGWRTTHRYGVREAARIIGVSPATFNRIENNKPCDGHTLSKILVWLLGPIPESLKRK